MNNKIKSLLSIAQKAGKLVSGEVSCEKILQKEEAKLIIISKDASDNTKNKFSKKSFYYKVPFLIYGTKEELGYPIGKSQRATIIITDENFAKKIQSLIEKS